MPVPCRCAKRNVALHFQLCTILCDFQVNLFEGVPMIRCIFGPKENRLELFINSMSRNRQQPLYPPSNVSFTEQNARSCSIDVDGVASMPEGGESFAEFQSLSLDGETIDVISNDRLPNIHLEISPEPLLIY